MENVLVSRYLPKLKKHLRKLTANCAHKGGRTGGIFTQENT